MKDPAFPLINGHQQFLEMTLRDYFAARAMEAILSSVHCGPYASAEAVSKNAYAMADAMLDERKGGDK